MKRTLCFLILMGMFSTAAFGLAVSSDPAGDFSVTGPGATFTSWATGTAGATIEGSGGFSTFVSNTWTMSAPAVSSDATLIIPFEFDHPLETAVISFSSQLHPYGSNWGRCIVYVSVNGFTTRVYQHDSPDYADPIYYNYNGAAPTGTGPFAATVDISDLVEGAGSFTVRFYAKQGWSSSQYNGGSYMTSASTNPDFVLVGSVDPTLPAPVEPTPMDETYTEDTVNVGGSDSFMYRWDLFDGPEPWVIPNATYEGYSYNKEASGISYLRLEQSEGSIVWHFWLPDGQTFDDDIVVTGGGFHLNSGEGSWWDGRWSSDGVTWHEFYYHSGNYFGDSNVTFLLSNHGYTGGGRHLYINWRGERTAGDAFSGQLFRGGLFEVRGSILGTPGPAPVYSIDSQGRWLKDGEQFIPLVMYLSQSNSMLQSAGFNTGLTGYDDPSYFMEALPALDDAYVHDIGIWYHLCNLFRDQEDYEGLTTIVNAFKDHPAIEAWYLADEPSIQPIDPAVLETAANMIRSLDPNHPVIGLDHIPSNFDDYAPVFDCFLSDPYPIPYGDITDVTTYIDISRAAINSDEALMVCLQAHGQPWYDRYPNTNEIWNMAYQAVVAGVHGIGWFAHGPAYESGSWPEYQELAGTLNTLMPFTSFSDSRVTYSGSGIYAAVFETATSKVLVAVNTTSSTQTLTIPVEAQPDFAAIGPLHYATLTPGSGDVQVTCLNLGCGAWDLGIAAAPLPGDANNDGSVDVGDLGILAANYGTVSGATWSLGDFNGDGAVDVGDLGILAANYGTNSSSSNWDADYAKVFGDDVSEEAETETSLCSSLGFPLIVGLAIMCLMLVKFRD